MQENKNGEHYFDQAAAAWDEKPERIALSRAVARAIADRVDLSDVTTAMEFGCGTGLVTLGLAPLVGKIVAVDTSGKMLEALNRKTLENRIGNITSRQIDLFNDPLPEDRFDLVYSSMTLHHVQDIPALLHIFNRLLRPDGYLALADLDAEDGGFHGEIPDVFHYGFDRQVLIRQMEGAGFSQVEFTTAHVMEKEHSRTGKPARFPVFLATGRK